ncbi:hypothetical protein NL676_012657 [Syzygium grande]|nr:hypothetical protein NL676_012657 [Syzygium grande]
MLASNSVMEKKYKLIADYMNTEHEGNGGNPATMDGYKYLVRLAEEVKVHSLSTETCRGKASPWLDGKAPHYRQELERMDGVITVEKVWNCEEGLLSESGDPEGRLKDLCLSFSLFKFICLRFASYSLPPKAHKKLWRLIEHMLRKENGHERVFRVIEIELAFLFDLFYTKYPVNLNLGRSFYRLLLLPFVVAVALISFSFQIETSDRRPGPLDEGTTNPGVPVFHATLNSEELAVFVTILLMMSILVIEFAHFGIMIFSEWAKVMYICKYVQNEWWKKNRCAGKLFEIMCRVWLLKPWGRQLRQYSLLEAYSYSPWKCIHDRLTAAYLDPKRDGQKQIAPINLSKEVTEAITRSLGKYCTGNLEEGQASLRLNGAFGELSWACHLETATHVIMVWHIATTFCEHEKPVSDSQLSQKQSDNFGIATKLSKYLAYLVAFAPRLLPGHPCSTEYIFDRAISEARELLKGSSVSMRERIQKLKTVADHEQSIVGRGAWLGRQLVNEVADEERIWEVLADFWAEMMLYVAPSNNTAAHAKYLTMGVSL